MAKEVRWWLWRNGQKPRAEREISKEKKGIKYSNGEKKRQIKPTVTA